MTDDSTDLSRRTFLRASGVAAGAGLLGTGTAAADGVDPRFFNPRVREARHAWERGYRGRPDRSLALTDSGTEARHPDLGPWNGVVASTTDGNELVLEDVDGGEIPLEEFSVDGLGAPRIVGFHNDTTGNYGPFDRPRDDNGHGSHVAGIMTGTGEASTVDPDRFRTETPRAVLLPGESLAYDVAADAGTGLFASALGEGVELVIEGPDGRRLADSPAAVGPAEGSLDPVIAGAPTTDAHDAAGGTRTYTVYVRPATGEAVAAGRVREVALAPFRPHEAADGETTDAGPPAVHAGVAPGYSVFSVLGLFLDVVAETDELAEQVTETFNVRAHNMSWGFQGGPPLGAFGGTTTVINERLRRIAESGTVPVAAAGNAATPANGNGAPGVVREAISVVATGPLDGIASYSSGGVGGVDAEGGFNRKPDVTAPGGQATKSDLSVRSGDSDSDAGFGDVRGYTGLAGTSMASPHVCGLVGLVAEAMEFTPDGRRRRPDDPEALTLPEPAETGLEDVLRLKSVVLATASETAFTAAPYHRGKAPTYTAGGRDPYEGYGRVNVGAAIDAVTRNLAPGAADLSPDDEGVDATYTEAVGLDVPGDPRAVAGYVDADSPFEAGVEFTHYSGGNAGLTKGDPHIDLFVYDVTGFDRSNGAPAIAAADQGLEGSASVSVEAADGGPYLVVAKLVNAPGVVNGYDVQANFEFGVSVDAPAPTPLEAEGVREVDSSVYFGRDLTRVEVTVEDVTSGEAVVLDRYPAEWDLIERFSDGVEANRAEVLGIDEEGLVAFGEFDDNGEFQGDTVAGDDGAVTFVYFVETPENVDDTGRYAFGPAEAWFFNPREAEDEFAGTDDAVVAGIDL